MRDLIIDTSTPTCSISLFEDRKLTASFHELIGRGHAEILIPEIQNITNKKSINRIYVNVGPGSFTGIRIGISAARALAMAWAVPCTGYSTMQLVAAMALKRDALVQEIENITTDQAAIDIIMTGGHGEYYVQSYNKHIEPINKLRSLSPDSASKQCKAAIVSGDKAQSIASANKIRFIPISGPDTRQFQTLQPFESLEVKPLYVRQPDAQKSVKLA